MQPRSRATLSAATLSSATLSSATLSSATLSSATLSWACLQTPVGQLSVGCSDRGVARLRYGRAAPPGAGGPPDRAAPGAAEILRAATAQLTEYLAGQRRVFELPLDWSGVPPAARQVLGTLLRSVGYGQTISYGELARRSGLTDPQCPARAVGQIMAANPLPVLIACHRVVASDGLGGYSGGSGPETKRWLLTLEGALPPTLDWQPAAAS